MYAIHRRSGESLTLGHFLLTNRVGELFTAPADISWGPDVLVQPDVFVVPVDDARTLTWSRLEDLFRPL